MVNKLTVFFPNKSKVLRTTVGMLYLYCNAAVVVNFTRGRQHAKQIIWRFFVKNIFWQLYSLICKLRAKKASYLHWGLYNCSSYLQIGYILKKNILSINTIFQKLIKITFFRQSHMRNNLSNLKALGWTMWL